jgi:hypothetical protein
MRVWGLVFVVACHSWQPVRATAIENENALVRTADRAYELDEASSTGEAIAGNAVRAWKATSCLHADDDSPAEIASRCSWLELDTSETNLSIARGEIRDVRAVRFDPLRTTLAVVGTLAVAAVLSPIVWFFAMYRAE